MMKSLNLAEMSSAGAAEDLTGLTDLTLSPVHQMASSCAGALIVSLFMTPLDVVKIRLQAQSTQSHSNKCFLYSNGLMDHLCHRLNGDPVLSRGVTHTKEEICNCKWYNRPVYFSGTFDALFKIARTEGASSLWSGLSPTLVLAIPTTVIYFTTYEQLKTKFKSQKLVPLNDQLSMGLSGGLARIWAVSIVSPLELIRTKMQSQKMSFLQVRSVLGQMVKNEGISSLWRGYAATLMRDVPFSAMYWPLYEGVKSVLRTKISTSPLIENFMAGAIAGTIASTVTLPMDVIKTHRQIDIGEKLLVNNPNVAQLKKTDLSIAKDIVNEKGFRGLFAGLSPRILKVAPACAIMISSYEYCKKYFSQRQKHI